MTAKHELHVLIGGLSEDEAARLLAALTDPVEYSMLTAPPDDKRETDEERAAVAEAKEEIERGEWYTLDEVHGDLDRRRG